ncbi:MAG TPA: TolC family protein [Haliscomenobacter sp.]|nr:TolC family protein [Haliscomenobacter sp.]
MNRSQLLNNICCLSLIIISTSSVFAQAPVLQVEDAVKLGLEKNFNVQILRNQELIAANNNTPARAGMTPTVNTTGTVSYAINNTSQRFFTGETRSAPNAGTFNGRIGVEAVWNLYNGSRMYAIRDRLTTFEQQSRALTTAQMQALSTDITLAYFNIVQLERTTSNLRYAVRLDRDLLNLVQAKKTIGSATGLELLQSRSRLTADSARLVQQEADIKRFYMGFNQLLNRPVEDNFRVDTTLSTQMVLTVDELLLNARQANPDVILSKLDQQVAMLNTKEIKGTFKPELDLTGAMNYSYQRNAVGFALSNRNFGPVLGLTGRYTIYDGQLRKQNLTNARIAEENAKLRQDELLYLLEAQIRTRYSDYQSLKQLRDLEDANLKVSLDQANLARELYRLGKITNFEVRESTLLEVQARDRTIQAWFRLKQVEIELLNLAGMKMF